MRDRIYSVEHETVYRYREAGPLPRAPAAVPSALGARFRRARELARDHAGRRTCARSRTCSATRSRCSRRARNPTRCACVRAFAIRDRARGRVPSRRSRRTPSAIPFDYTAEERRDLGARLEPHYPDPDGQAVRMDARVLRRRIRARARSSCSTRWRNRIRADFAYVTRDAEGTQTPDETLRTQERHVSRLRAADDRGRAPARHGRAVCLRLSLRSRARS